MIRPAAAADATEFLVRSRLEVLRLLNAMLAGETPLSIIPLGSGIVLDSLLVYVDGDSDTLLLTCPSNWEAAVAGGSAIMVGCVFENTKIEFQGGVGAIVDLEGAPVVGLPIPKFMWRFQRRADPRRNVSGLKILLNMGFLEAEAEVVDLSVGGIGLLNCHSELKLEPGEVMRDCVISLPGIGDIPVNLTVQHVIAARLADGRSVVRAGCRFSGLKDNSRQMIARFLELVSQK